MISFGRVRSGATPVPPLLQAFLLPPLLLVHPRASTDAHDTTTDFMTILRECTGYVSGGLAATSSSRRPVMLPNLLCKPARVGLLALSITYLPS